MTNGAHNPAEDQITAVRSALRIAKRQLLAAKVQLDDDDFFDSLSQDQKAEAIDKSLRLTTRILQIENAQIALIVSQVEDNLEALKQATQDLEDALQSVENVTRLFRSIGALLGIVLRIVAI